MWYVNTIINWCACHLIIFVLYKLCDMWIMFLRSLEEIILIVLYKLCDMWINERLDEVNILIKVLYKLCDMWIKTD